MITKELIEVRNRFRALHPDVVSIGFRFSRDKPVIHVLYWKDESFPLFFEGIPVVIEKSDKGVLC